MTTLTCKVLIIGGGPGGYVAAIRSGQLGLDTVLVEKAELGGTCLNIGCIPSKALIHAADTLHGLVSRHLAPAMGINVQPPRLAFDKTQHWKNGIVERLTGGVAGLLKKHKVRVLRGHADCIDGKTWSVATDHGRQLVRAEHVVIATGSVPAELATLPFGGHVISSTEALSLHDIPPTMVVVGAGYIGLELGTAYAKLGSKVTVLEAADRILPAYDRDLTAPVAKKLAALGIEVRLSARVRGAAVTGRAVEIERADGSQEIVPADVVLVAIGRGPLTAGFGLEKLDLTMNGRFIGIDATCATSMRNVWAIGDVTGDPMLAHRAMAQGEMVAEIIAGHKRTFDKIAIPAVCFTDPEIVAAGRSPDEAKEAGLETKIGVFPLLANARSLTKQDDSGFVRIVARTDNHAVVGIQAVGHGVSELSSAFGLALEMGARLEDIAATIHAHPTQGEGFQEAALKALGHALHI